MSRFETKQDYGTPREFLRAVVERFGPIDFDLAAHAGNHVVDDYFSPEEDAFTRDWTELSGNLWLNPPFRNIAPWAKKCKETMRSLESNSDLRGTYNLFAGGQRILLLTPAGVCTNWFLNHVFDVAHVLLLHPRIQFVGADTPGKQDMILSVFDRYKEPGFSPWKWKEEERENRQVQLM